MILCSLGGNHLCSMHTQSGVCNFVSAYSVLKTLVPQFNLIAKRFVDVTLKPQADGKTVVEFRNHYRMLAIEAISLVCEML